MLFAIVPAAPPTRKNQRTTSCPAPISANVPYHRGSRLILSALEWVSIGFSFTGVGPETVLNPFADETRERFGDENAPLILANHSYRRRTKVLFPKMRKPARETRALPRSDSS